MNARLATMVLVVTFICVAANLDAKAQTPVGERYVHYLRSGNIGAMNQLVATTSLNPLLGRMGKAQLAYNVADLAQAATECEHRASKVKAAVADAVYCSKVARAAYITTGNWRAILRQTIWEEENLYPILDKHDHVNQPLVSKLKRDMGRTPAPSLTWGTERRELPIRRKDSGDATHTLNIPMEINGHSVQASLAVGALSTPLPFPIIITEPLNGHVAGALGLGKEAPGESAIVHRRTPPAKGAARRKLVLYVVSNVTIGPLTLHHLAVPVYSTPFVAPGVYIRMNLLRDFGAVAIGKDHVLLSKEPLGVCKPMVRMSFAANKHLVGHLIFAAHVDARPVKATLNFGDGRGVVVERQALSTDSGSAGHVHQNEGGGRRPSFQVGQITISSVGIVPDSTKHQPYMAQIGNGVLGTHSVYLTFDGAYPTVCLGNGGLAGVAR